LLVEDDIQLNKTIKRFLELQNYSVASAYDGNSAIDIIDSCRCDLYIIDINIPNISGLELLEYIRNKDIKTPVIIITASLEIENFEEAYEGGCSEYIKKPFHLKELDIRIKNLLNIKKEKIVKLRDNIIYNISENILIVNDESMKLRKKEQRLLFILMEKINETVYNEAIISYVWENEVKDNYPIRQLVNQLRGKLQEDIIITEVGIGYRLKV
ncbi:MAG: response regulator transcription factor, partial [Campylobacterota bacterium]|nr:response regulator transcription factor [Campylobacterota bacterium]